MQSVFITPSTLLHLSLKVLSFNLEYSRSLVLLLLLFISPRSLSSFLLCFSSSDSLGLPRLLLGWLPFSFGWEGKIQKQTTSHDYVKNWCCLHTQWCGQASISIQCSCSRSITYTPCTHIYIHVYMCITNTIYIYKTWKAKSFMHLIGTLNLSTLQGPSCEVWARPESEYVETPLAMQ